MSLADFQRALADLVSSPDLCGCVRTDSPGVLDRYTLTARERSRIVAIVNQRGMSVNCTLYRSSRFEALYTLLPLTCLILGDQLRAELDQYWRFREHSDLQFRTEVAYWTEFLWCRMRAGHVNNPYLREVLSYEVAAIDLSYGSGPELRIVAFSHDPTIMLSALRERRMPPLDVPSGAYYLLLAYRGGRLRVARINAELARAVAAQSVIVDDALTR